MARPGSLMPLMVISLASLVFLCGSQQVEARGCIKGAAVGAVAGHVAGRHAVVGGVAGCAVGHHLAKKQQREQRQQRQAAQAPQAVAPAVSPSGQAPQ
jgi:hypothetical protein